MKRNAINYIRATFIGLLSLFCLPNLYAQCEEFVGAAGIDKEIFIDFPINEIDLDLLLASNRIANNRNLLVNSSWSFVSGPRGPRGPLVLFISEDDDVDFPNTGAGPDEEYVFEYTVTDGGCEDSATITIWVFISDSSTDEKIIYTCPGETIASANELFNVFSLNQLRDLDQPWYFDPVFPNEDILGFPTGIGSYAYLDGSFNELKAEVQEIGCSDKNIKFSFANAQNTNDGTNDFFEVDVMMQTTGFGSSFKLGDGKLLFRYNTAAFGEYVNAYKRIEITQQDGYITGQSIDSDPSQKIYWNFKTLDNTNDDVTNRFSWGFKQNNSASSFAADNVTNTPNKLCHLKIKYVDVHENPMLIFETDGIYDNQFTDADQINLLINDTFENKRV